MSNNKSSKLDKFLMAIVGFGGWLITIVAGGWLWWQIYHYIF